MVEFEAILTHTTGLTTTNLLNCFISGLKDDIKRELFLLKPSTLPEAMGVAKLVEFKLQSPRYYTPKPAPFPSLPNQTLLKPIPTHTTLPPNSKLPIKRLTPAEMAARRERGLCFNCDEKFVPGHRCKPPQFLCLLVEEDTEEQSPATNLPIEMPHVPEAPAIDITPAVYLDALEGRFVPTTLRLEG